MLIMNDKIIISKPGIYDIPEEIYHADPCVIPSLSSSGSKIILKKSPRHFLYETENEVKKPAFRFGSAAHINLLEPHRFGDEYYILPEGLSLGFAASKDLKESLDNDKDRLEDTKQKAKDALKSGKILLSFADGQKVDGMADGMLPHKNILQKFMAAPKEQSGFYFHKAFKIWCRVRFDWLPINDGSILADYKTLAPQSGAMNDQEIAKAMHNFGWFQSAAWYIDAVIALGLHPNPRYLFVIQEKNPPYDVVIRELSETALTYGRILNAKAMDIFSKCLDSNHWPGYGVEPRLVELPEYAYIKMERDCEDGVYELQNKIRANYWYKGIEDE